MAKRTLLPQLMERQTRRAIVGLIIDALNVKLRSLAANYPAPARREIAPLSLLSAVAA
jgi:hypothetical protein